MAVRFSTKAVIKLFQEKGGKTKFINSLEDVLTFIQNDKNINNVNEVAYLLATAKAESDYSLQRWEADYLCGSVGVAYKNKPCQKALNYYKSSSGNKTNYYNLGIDKNGLPYFGRGLIQLTGKANYKKYGDLIGVNLVNDGDKALVPKNSYKIASEYLSSRTFKYVNSGALTSARKSVNGGTNGLNEVNSAYSFWLSILNNPKAKFKSTKMSLKQRRRIAIIVVSSTILLVSLSLYSVFKRK